MKAEEDFPDEIDEDFPDDDFEEAFDWDEPLLEEELRRYRMQT